MSDWEKDEYPWLEKSDLWFRRSYIGDTEIVEVTRTDSGEKNCGRLKRTRNGFVCMSFY